jgi:hypothetical protein
MRNSVDSGTVGAALSVSKGFGPHVGADVGMGSLRRPSSQLSPPSTASLQAYEKRGPGRPPNR